MDDEVQLISDGKGLAVIGSEQAVERFVAAEGVAARDLGLPRLSRFLSAGSGLADAGSTIAGQHGRWIKLTKDSADKLAGSTAMKGSSADVSRAILTDKGKIKSVLEFSNKHSDVLTNPAVLAGAAGLMAQLAMQQTMDEITDYLAAIDEKVDDILQAQKDAVLADMLAAGLVLDDAIVLRDRVGRVSEVTWSKVQSTAFTIARTQAYAMRQLDSLATKLEGMRDVGDLAETTRRAEETTRQWLAVLARCFQLQDASAILELDRVIDSGADEVEAHREALEKARERRTDQMVNTTVRLVTRVNEAAATANTKVLTSPRSAGGVVRARNQIAKDVGVFNEVLGITQDAHDIEARRWAEAAADVKDRALERGAMGVGTAKRFGMGTASRAKATTGKVAGRMPEVSVTFRRRKSDSEN